MNMHVRYRPEAASKLDRLADSHHQIRDAVGNNYAKPRGVAGERRFAFHTHADSAFDVCFENILQSAALQHLPIVPALTLSQKAFPILLSTSSWTSTLAQTRKIGVRYKQRRS